MTKLFIHYKHAFNIGPKILELVYELDVGENGSRKSAATMFLLSE
jgi:hypothetical protein